MHTLRVNWVKGGTGWWLPALALLILASVLSAVIVRHNGFAAASPAPAPVYVSNVSSMIGTADGSLIEGGTLDQQTAPAPPVASQTIAWSLIGFSLLGLSVCALGGAALFTRLRRRL